MIPPIRSILRRSGAWGTGLKSKRKVSLKLQKYTARPEQVDKLFFCFAKTTVSAVRYESL